MGLYRIGGLAVALGIGSAVVAGHGVASADTSGESGSESPSSSSSTEGSASTESSSAKPSSKPTPAEGDDAGASDKTEIDTNETDTTETPDDLAVDGSADDESPTPNKRSKKQPPSSAAAGSRTPADANASGSASVVARAKPAPKAATPDNPAAVTDVAQTPVANAPAITITTVSQPADPAIRKPVEVATVALSQPVSALLDPFAGDAPTAPIASPLMWTMAAAARRELSAATTTVDQPADLATNSLVTETPLAAIERPKVVAIEQIAPLAFLQQIPILGPVVFTPIVAVIHGIPVVGDVLHRFVGYPVEFGLPAGAPKPRDFKVISDDGTPIYVHFIPARGLTATAQAPTVLNGPGLALAGATTLNGTIFDPFAADLFGMLSVGTLRDAGYNVVTWDPRGEWSSGGQLELNSADFEGRDMSAIISWLADQPEVLLDKPGDPRMGMVGVSYGGGIQLVTAANDKRVDAIVPAITYHRLDTALYKNEAFKSSWATPLTAALGLTLARINPRILPAAVYGALTGQMTQGDEDLLIARNPAVDKITVPTLLIQGTVDTIFSLQEADDTAQILIANGVPTKVVWFCGGHGVCAHNLIDFSDGSLIEKRTLEWLNRYVKGDLSVPTGPQFEWVDQRGQWHSSNTYPVSKGAPIVSIATDKTLPLIPYIGGSGIPFVPLAFKAPNAVNIRVPATTQTYLMGAPELTLTYSGTGSSRHVYAQLVDDSSGLVLGYIATPIPVTLDGTTRTVTVDLEPVAHTLRPGESVTLQLVASAGLYERIIPALGVLNVSSMQLTLPTANPAAVQTI